MNKFRGKALAAVLSLALVASSFPVTLASAKTKNASGVLTKGPDNDEFWMVNGGSKDERSVENFQDMVYDNGDAPLETSDHKDVDDPEVYSISHVSGDKLVSWDIGKDDDDNDQSKGDVKLSLRKSDSEGEEVIAILYKGTYTDDDDNDVDVTASTQVTIHAVDEDSTVIGDASGVKDGYYDYGTDLAGTDSPEIDGTDSDDDNFALKTTKGLNGEVVGETKEIAVFKAEKDDPTGGNCMAQWKMLKTISEDGAKKLSEDAGGAGTESDFINNNDDYAYVLECNTAEKNLRLSDGTLGEAGNDTYASVTPATGTVTDVTVEPEASKINGSVTITNTSSDNDYWYGVDDNTPVKLDKGGSETATLTYDADGGDGKVKDGTQIKIYEADESDSTKAASDPTDTYTYSAGSEGADPVDSTGIVTASVPNGASTASLTFKAKVTDAFKTDVKDDDDIKAKSKIEKKVLVDDATGTAAYRIYKDDTYNKTVLAAVSGAAAVVGDAKKGSDSSTKLLDINGGYTVKFNNINATVTIEDDASIDAVKGKVEKVKVDDAKKVGDIDLKAGSIAIEDSDVKVGDITTKGNGDITNPTIDIDADNSVGTITVKNDDSGSSEVTVSAGSVKAINTKGSVELNGEDDDEPISVGTVNAKNITIDSNDGAVTVSSIVISEPSNDENGAEIDLKGDETTIKAIDLAGYGVDVKADDFQGTIPAPLNATADDTVLETTDEDDDVTVTGDLDINEVTLEDESKIVFEGSLSVDSLDGSGTMYIGANKLYVGEDATGVLVKITDNTIKAGDTIFTAASDAVDEDDLDFYGFTVKCNEGKSTDTFVVDQLQFAGLALNKISDKIVLNDSATYTASAYAPGTSIPEGYSIEFDITDNSGVFELTDNGNGTATVKCVDYDDTFSEENKATLEAYVVDEDGDEDDDYGMAECNLTALKTPEKTFVSDTNNDFTLASGASYQFKITDATAPVMTAGTAGVVDIANVGKSGNDYFIKVTAKGAANAKTGIYVNGTKLLVITVGGVVCDTTKDITVKKGASYQYKVTASAAPTFGIGTAGVFNYSLVSHSGNNYFYKITAVGAVGATAGVYVNGQKVNVAKVG